MNHTMNDGFGIVQFMKAIAEIANGATKPSIQPVWHRELLNARDPPQVTFTHHEYDEEASDNNTDISTTNDFVHRSFFFGPTEVSSLRKLLPDHLRQSTSFEVVTACLWRCRTKALKLDPHEHVRMMVIVNTRDYELNPPLPKGYYGNAVVFPTAVSSAGKLCESPLEYALELVKKAKAQVNEEYIHSVIDIIATRRPICCEILSSCMVSDLSSLGSRDADFGWGKALYAGPAKSGLGNFLGVTFYAGHRNSKGQEGRLVPICLPHECMERFAKELDQLLNVVP